MDMEKILGNSYVTAETMHSLSRSVAVFLEIHKWAISRAALATRALRYGTSLGGCAQDAVILCDLELGWGATESSRKFSWDSMRIVRFEEALRFINGVSHMEDEVMRAFSKAKAGTDALYSPTDNYLGALPIVYKVGIYPVVLWHINPQFKPTHRTPLSSDEWSIRVPVLEDMRTLCMKCVNAGVVLRGDEGGVALPGRFVRSRGRRHFKPYISNMANYKEELHLYPEVAEALKGPYTSKLHPQAVMEITDKFR